MKEYEIAVTKVRARFADMLNIAAYDGGRVLIMRRGRLLGALISYKDYRRLRTLPSEPDPYEEAERFWQITKRVAEERVREAEERAAKREAERLARGESDDEDEARRWDGYDVEDG